MGAKLVQFRFLVFVSFASLVVPVSVFLLAAFLSLNPVGIREEWFEDVIQMPNIKIREIEKNNTNGNDQWAIAPRWMAAVFFSFMMCSFLTVPIGLVPFGLSGSLYLLYMPIVVTWETWTIAKQG